MIVTKSEYKRISAIITRELERLKHPENNFYWHIKPYSHEQFISTNTTEIFEIFFCDDKSRGNVCYSLKPKQATFSHVILCLEPENEHHYARLILIPRL